MEANNNTSVSKIKSENRIAYFDYLRVLATIAVIFLHVSAQNWYSTDVNGLEWQTFNIYDSLSRWGVPVFLMISGGLFLEKEITIKKIYSKYILRMVIAFLVWSFIYSLFSTNITISERIILVFSGHYHMWFILMIIGIYMCLPIINTFAKNHKILKYYLLLSIIFAFMIPQLSTLINDFGNERLIKYNSAFNNILNNMKMSLVLGYVSYFVLGYYIKKIDFTKKQRISIYMLGIVGAIATIVLDLIVAIKTQKYCSHYYGSFNFTVMVQAVALFILFKQFKFKPTKFIITLSKYSFGAYLAHVLVINQLDSLFGLNTLSFNPILSVTCISLITAVISYSLSALIHQIPILKKYIV